MRKLKRGNDMFSSWMPLILSSPLFWGIYGVLPGCSSRPRQARKRFNVLGALDAISHEMITVTNIGYINAESVCEILSKIAMKCCNIPVSIVLDNARYQKCKLVQELADSLKIELLHLPPYSPNLNLIERVWRFVKRKCLYSKYYSDFDSFVHAISDCLARTNGKYRKELDSFLSLKFQSFKKSHIIAF